eukprot:TRINITY_DN32085_c0_g1_i2.p1 TRINITY_DN32085_c0_g1~~TRINITY_DN32085_c0_g1_i2.p1  ORF type:complete len:1177 (-),score=131.80 TRINITY_DN32085_c0_g1_i2:374-3904(-)
MDSKVGAFGPARFPVFAPSDWEPDQVRADAVVDAPSLSYVHGFTAAARPAVTCLSFRQVAFAAGRLVVLMDVETGSQEFIDGHTAEVTCMAYTPEQRFGASGQLRAPGARCAEVMLWSPDSLGPVIAPLRYHQSDIEAIGFAQGGQVLLTIGADRDHTIAMWPSGREGWFSFRRRDRGPLAVCSSYKSGRVCGLLAAPEVESSPPAFVTYGEAHVKFWHSDRTSPALESRRGAFGSHGPPAMVVAAAWAKGGLIAAGNDGTIYFFQETLAVQRIQPQRSCVGLLAPMLDSVFVAFANGVLVLLKDEGNHVEELAKVPGAPDERMQSPIVGGVKVSTPVLQARRSGSVVLASQTHLLRLDLGLDGQPQSCEVLLWQASQPLTAVCSHAVEPRIYTGSLDGCVRCYRSVTQKTLPEYSFRASGGVTCLAVSACPPGCSAWLAVGCDDGFLSVISDTSGRYVFRRSLTTKKTTRLTCARFSSCDASGMHPLWLAVGTEDGLIHTFRFKDPLCRSAGHSGPETVKKEAVLRGHNAPIVDVSFADTLPCCFLLSVDAAGQTLAFDAPMAQRLPSVAMLRDSPFAPWTSPVGWPVLGCWQSELSPKVKPDGTAKALLPDRRFCEVPGRALVAASTADGIGDIELYPFPCPSRPSRPARRLIGPAASVSALTHGVFGGSLLAASQTALFVWSWEATSPMSHSLDRVAGAVARSSEDDVAWGSPSTPPKQKPQGVVMLVETPDGRQKQAVAAENAHVLLTPQRVKAPAASSRRARLDAPQSRKAAVVPKALMARTGAGPSAGGGSLKAAAKAQGAKRTAIRSSSTPALRVQPPCHEAELDYPVAGEMGALPAFDAATPPLPLPLVGAGEVMSTERDVVRDVRAGEWDDRDGPDGGEAVAPLAATWPARPAAPWLPVEGEPYLRDWNTYVDGGRGELMEQRRKSRDALAPKIGSRMPARFEFDPDGRLYGRGALVRQSSVPSAGPGQEIKRIHADTNYRARAVQQRHRVDSVGALLHSGVDSDVVKAPPEMAQLPLGNILNPIRAGHFQYRARDLGTQYEVEVHIPGGELLSVARNPLRRTMTFEGRVNGQPQEERLVVPVPPGFDLQAAPEKVERRFAEGRCSVALRAGSAGGLPAPPAVALPPDAHELLESPVAGLRLGGSPPAGLQLAGSPAERAVHWAEAY